MAVSFIFATGHRNALPNIDNNRRFWVIYDKPTLRPMPGTDGQLWTCGRPGQTRHVGLSPEAAYRSWRHMQ